MIGDQCFSNYKLKSFYFIDLDRCTIPRTKNNNFYRIIHTHTNSIWYKVARTVIDLIKIN